MNLRAVFKKLGLRQGGAVALALAALALAAGAAQAQEAAPPSQPAESDSPFHSLAKGFGFATDVDPPPDFVQKSRPAEPSAEIPIFTPPDEPPGKVKSAREVEGIDSDLEAIGKRHDALRAAYPPAAKAVAQRAAEKKAKSQRKPTAAGAPPQ
jgi:hypothetical protein